MKTPAEIATATIGKEPTLAEERATWEAIVAGIEADRKQANEVAVTLPSGQEITVWVGTSDADGSALVQIDTGGANGNVRVFINDSDDPLLDENPETGKYEDNSRECSQCGDEVATLSTDDLCDGCVAENVCTVICPNCGERVDEGDMSHWPNLAQPISMCSSCEHDARRSGWEPGQ